jgi:hypothetical protein
MPVKATVSLHTVEDVGKELPDGNLRDLRVDLPAGLLADPTALPSCTNALHFALPSSMNFVAKI